MGHVQWVRIGNIVGYALNHGMLKSLTCYILRVQVTLYCRTLTIYCPLAPQLCNRSFYEPQLCVHILRHCLAPSGGVQVGCGSSPRRCGLARGFALHAEPAITPRHRGSRWPAPWGTSCCAVHARHVHSEPYTLQWLALRL